MPHTQENKRKPPTFKHYPAAKARSLKRAWVEKAKIKSKWKAEKRKSQSTFRGQEGRNTQVHDEDGSHAEESDSGSNGEDDTLMIKTSAQPSPTHSQARDKKPESSSIDDSLENFRERARQAYSRSSLHTYKSDPLKRRQGADRGRGHGGSAGRRGRGQPNMKLRMGVMLEKIKRDLA